MAQINFLNTLNFNQNEAVSFRLDVEASNPSSPSPVGGQLYYNSGDDTVRFYSAGASQWVTLANTAQAGVTDITSGNGAASSGNAITSQTSATGSVTIESFAFAGSANVGHVPAYSGGSSTTNFLRADGSWSTVDNYGSWEIAENGTANGDVTSGDKVDFIDGTITEAVVTGTSSPYTVTFNHNDVTRSDTTSSASPGYGGTFDVISSITTSSQGHVTDVNTETITMPAAETYDWDIDGDSGGALTVSDQFTVDIAGGNIITTALTTSGAGTSTIRTLTVNHDAISTDTTAGTPVTLSSGGTFTAINSMAFDGYGHTDTATPVTFTLPDSLAPGDITAQNGVYNTGTSASPVIEVDYRANTNNIIDSAGTGSTPTADDHFIFSVDNGGDADGLVKQNTLGSVTLDIWGTPTADVDMGTNGGSLFNIKNLKDPVDEQDAATKAYVDLIASKALEFKGTFNPANGLIATGTNAGSYLYQLTGGSFDSSKARVALETGDLYIATGSGDFYANTATPLTTGDQVFALNDVAANTSVESDWAVVQSDTDVATYAAIGLGNVNVQDDSSATSGYHGSTSGAATGGVLNVNYTNGTAAIELRESSASDLGIVKIAEGSGISVTYSNGEATIATSGNPSGKRVSLDSTLGYVTKASSGGVTTFTVDLQSASVFGGSTLALDTKAEVITSGGETVYPVVERSSGDISFAFSELPSAPSDGDYEVLLIVVS
tara:strand:+ start:2588 stop:4750 length:2163 start_codon:yes stop_codon:yes gene_type:complete